jgi:elongation factor 2
MPSKKTIEEIRLLMEKQNNIRNMSVIAHVDHGKSTLTDSLLSEAGIIAMEQAGDTRLTDTRTDEQERGITIKSTGISLYYELTGEMLEKFGGPRDGNHYLINLIDSPGHVDFSSEVTAALRITDGALVVVDCVEGVCVQTETVLRQALEERIKPILTVNKLDRCFFELKLEGEEAYLNFRRVIENVNVVMATYADEKTGETQVYPDKGNVSFSAGLHGWAFTLTTFANIYALKFGVEPDKMIGRLWGDNFFDTTSKKWYRNEGVSSTCIRGFVKLVYDPIKTIIDAAVHHQIERLSKITDQLGINGILRTEDREMTGKPLMKRVLQSWIPAHKALLEMIVYHLPSPAAAQKYRYETLYKGPLDDRYAKSIQDCNPNGPLVMYVSKMIPTSDKGRFYAFGRVFSGKVSTGHKVRIMGANYEAGEKKDLYIKPVQRTVLWMGRRHEAVEDVPCGNTVSLVGLDQCIDKTATISDADANDCFPLKAMKFSVFPVVSVAVACKVASDLSKLVEGLKRLGKSDPMVQCTIDPDTKEYIIAGAGDLHLEICLKDLQEEFMGGAEIKKSPPVVSFCETVSGKSDHVVMCKSPNKHNRIYLQAVPFEEGLAKAIDDKKIGPRDNPKTRAKIMSEEFGWDKELAKNIWCFGPDETGANLVVDNTKGIQNLNEIRESVKTAFQEASKKGPIADESIRGCRFEIVDCVLHADAIHRGDGQIIGTARRAFCAAMLCAQPRLMEPVYEVQIQTPESALGGIYSTFNTKRGQVFEQIPRPGTPWYSVKAYLPVYESIGRGEEAKSFTEDLRASTAGQAFHQCLFSHWDMLLSDPLESGSMSNNIACEIRERKKINKVPQISEFEDKL